MRAVTTHEAKTHSQCGTPSPRLSPYGHRPSTMAIRAIDSS